MKNYVKNYLFAEPSIIEGMARIVDLGGTLQIYNYSDSTENADIKALSNDWYAVGSDIRQSINLYEKQPTASN